MVTVQLWKDAEGYGFQFDQDKFSLSPMALEELVSELEELVETPVECEEGLYRELCLDVE